MKQVLLVIFCSFSFLMNAQKADLEKTYVGIEQDVLPYIFRGYILTGWIGRNQLRHRFSYAQATTPSFYLGEGISNDRVNAFGLSFEYFFKENFNGLWVGPGIGYWTNHVTLENAASIKNESVIFTLGGGYNYALTNWLYVSPWVALHSRVSGSAEIQIGNIIYKPAIFTPELSVKVGVMLGR